MAKNIGKCTFTKYVTEAGVPYYYSPVEGVAVWERPDGYESESGGNRGDEASETIVLEFRLTDDNGNEVTLISELIRMKYIHADNAEICAILSGDLNEKAMTKLQILQAHLNMHGTEWEWMHVIKYDDYNFLSYLLLYMNISTHNDLKECASKCLAFLSNVYPKLWHDYLGTINPNPNDDGAATSSIVNKYVLLNVILLIHTGIGQICDSVVRLANSKVEDQLRNIHVNNSNYIGFDARDVAEYNLNVEDYDTDTTARDRNDGEYISLSSVITHGIIGMEDVCDAEASVRVWLLLLTQIFAYIPSLHAILNVSACSPVECAALNKQDRSEVSKFTVDDYIYPAMDEQLLCLHDFYNAYFLSKTAADASTNSAAIDGFLSDNASSWGAVANAGAESPNALVYTCYFKKFLVRSADVLLRHAKYFSNDAYPLALKYIATVNYQLQQLELQTPAHDVNMILETLHFLHGHGKEGCTINISEMLLHVLNENGYPSHDALDTIPCISLCKDILTFQMHKDRAAAEAAEVARKSKSVFKKALAASVGTSESSYFYTNDMRVLVDIVERELVNLPSSSSALVKNDTRPGGNRRGSVSSLQTSCLGMTMAAFNYKVKLAYIQLAGACIQTKGLPVEFTKCRELSEIVTHIAETTTNNNLQDDLVVDDFLVLAQEILDAQ